MRKIVLSILAVLLLGLTLSAQNVRVSGTVTDNNGAPMAGVTVIVQGTQTGTVTGADGNYAISAPANGAIQFAHLGMVTELVPVSGRTTINVQMEIDTKRIDDVIVVAFGTATKESFTGSAATLGSQEISKRTSTNVASSLAGQLPGVQIRSNNGQPGSEPKINIRGIGSLYATTDPLIILDGAPFTGSMSNINPDDIETFTVLKDAASNALYGSRGANGVIMITTKRGKRQEALINFNGKVGVGQRLVNNYDMITDPAQHYEMIYGALYNYHYLEQGNTAVDAWTLSNNMLINDILKYNVYDTGGQPLIGQDGKLNPNAKLGNVITGTDGKKYMIKPDDWQEEAYKNSIRQEYSINISGGTDRASFFASMGYLDDQGIIDNSSYKRITANLKSDYQAKKWLKVGGSIMFTNVVSSVAQGYTTPANNSGNIFAFTSLMAPIYPVYIRDENGKIIIDKYGMKTYDYGKGEMGLERPYMSAANPLQEISLNDDSTTANVFNLHGFVDIIILPELKVTINASDYLRESRGNYYINKLYGQNASNNGMLRKTSYRYNNLNFQQLINYSNKFGKHSVEGLLGHETESRRTAFLRGDKNGVFASDLHELNTTITLVDAQSYSNNYITEGYFIRGQYDYNQRYFFTGSFRRDASSRFPTENRWGNFWSIGGAWLISNEAFLNVPWIDMLKFKLNYGQQGNDAIGNFRYVSTYTVSDVGGEPAANFMNIGNRDITWETNANFNTGIEFELFDRRLSGSIEYYNRTTLDLLFQRPVPESAGYRTYWANIGDMRNHGVEIDLRGTVVRRKDLNVTLFANFTSNTSKILKLPVERITEDDFGRKLNGFDSDGYWYGEGDPLYTWYMQKYAGVNEKGQSMWYVDKKDTNGNIYTTTTTAYTEASKYKCETALPKGYGGFGTSIYFKGIDFSISFDYQIGGLVYDSGYANLMSPFSDKTGTARHKDLLMAWSPERTSSNIPRFQYLDQNVASTSDRFLIDASYLNLGNINLGYTFPAKLTNKIKLNTVRMYCVAENIKYWSKRKGLDPRQNFNGSTTYVAYSPIRTISGGLQITF